MCSGAKRTSQSLCVEAAHFFTFSLFHFSDELERIEATSVVEVSKPKDIHHKTTVLEIQSDFIIFYCHI